MPVTLKQIGQIALPATDVDRSEDFYGKVLGLRRLYRFGDLTFFDCAGVRLLLEKATDVTGARGYLYFHCADIALTVTELTRRAPPSTARRTASPGWTITISGWPSSRIPGHMLALMREAPKDMCSRAWRFDPSRC